MKLCMATGNDGKVKELRELLKDLDIEIYSLKDFKDIEEVPETGTSFLENSVQKVVGYAKQVKIPCLADDSGLCVDALNGNPGIYSARFADTDREKCEKMLKLMEGKENRNAHFNCFATLCLPPEIIEKIREKKPSVQIISNNIVCCVGVLEGEIGHKIQGENGFGFDPIFTVKGKHLAEYSSEEKNEISHRGKAMRQIKEILSLL